MPPKKRKAASAAAAATAPAGKKVRIGDESVIEEDNMSATGRLRRSTSNDNPRYNFTNTRGGRGGARGAASRGGRGAGRGGRGGGRGGAKTAATAATAATATAVAQNKTAGTGRGRGRPKKTVEPEPEPELEDQAGSEGEGEIEDEAEPVKTTKAGRKGILKKNTNAAAATAKAEADANDASVPTKRGRGRPPAGTNAKPAVEKKPAAGTDAKAPVEKKKPGRPAKKPKLEEDGLTDEEALNKGAAALLHESVDPEIQYWLMKAEPESRMEKGVDVKFSIDDLAAKTEPEGWDGKSCETACLYFCIH